MGGQGMERASGAPRSYGERRLDRGRDRQHDANRDYLRPRRQGLKVVPVARRVQSASTPR